jgi:chromosome condensin MukBEF ATPase and DNA-binding subunit MukB
METLQLRLTDALKENIRVQKKCSELEEKLAISEENNRELTAKLEKSERVVKELRSFIASGKIGANSSKKEVVKEFIDKLKTAEPTTYFFNHDKLFTLRRIEEILIGSD